MSDGWIKWFGHGTPPVTGGRRVEARTRNGIWYLCPVGELEWCHCDTGGDIVAYKLEERRVGEVWGNEHHRRAEDKLAPEKTDGWIAWDGVCPPKVPGNRRVRVRYSDGWESGTYARVAWWSWCTDTVAYLPEERRSGHTPLAIQRDDGVLVSTPRRRKGDKPPSRVLPTDAAARKALPAYSGFIAYFPDAIVAVAELSRKGNDQHNPGKPLHWDRSKSGDELDALSRHLLEAGTIDTDGVRHSTKLAWRAMANLQKEIERSRK